MQISCLVDYHDGFFFLKKDLCTKKRFLGVFPFDRKPRKIKFPACFILNTAKTNEQGEHWIALDYDKYGHCEFFDSYGLHPKLYKLKSYLDKTATSWSFNSKQLQDYNSQTCGYFCFIFLILNCRKIKIKKIKKSLINNFIDNFLKY